MSYQDYSLEVISKHNQFKDKVLCKYHVDGIDTVGAWGSEPFEIKFKNNTYNKVQVKITLDGTDVLSGQPGTTEVSEKMWVVNPWASMTLKAWPETHNGGAGFVFTDTSNSVAAHTHGNLSAKGIIAAAVYVEGHVEPIYHSPLYSLIYPCNVMLNGNMSGASGGSSGTFGSIVHESSITCQNTTNSNTVSDGFIKQSESLRSKSSAAVGAGDFVEQKVTYVSGLIKPIFNQAIQVRYMWWDDLVSKLKEQDKVQAHPTGFPADKNPQLINLGSTPRLKTNTNNHLMFTSEKVYSRV